MPFRHGPYHPDARDRLTTVMIEIVLPVGKLPLMICSKQAVSCHVCFNFSRLNSRLLALHSGNKHFTITHQVHELDLRNIKMRREPRVSKVSIDSQPSCAVTLLVTPVYLSPLTQKGWDRGRWVGSPLG